MHHRTDYSVIPGTLLRKQFPSSISGLGPGSDGAVLQVPGLGVPRHHGRGGGGGGGGGRTAGGVGVGAGLGQSLEPLEEGSAVFCGRVLGELAGNC